MCHLENCVRSPHLRYPNYFDFTSAPMDSAKSVTFLCTLLILLAQFIYLIFRTKPRNETSSMVLRIWRKLLKAGFVPVGLYGSSTCPPKSGMSICQVRLWQFWNVHTPNLDHGGRGTRFILRRTQKLPTGREARDRGQKTLKAVRLLNPFHCLPNPLYLHL